MSQGRFGTAINCMDGRVQLPVIQWLKSQYHLDYVDMITEPGADRVMAEGLPDSIALVRAKVLISVNAHGSRLIAIVGHTECAGNPVSREEHLEHIQRAVQVVRGWDLPSVTVIGLWVNAQWAVEKVVA
jgi:carbonic anhydrase